MTNKDATKIARQMFGKKAFAYTKGSPFYFVCDGTKDAAAGRYYVAVGIGLSWEEAVKDANRYRRTKNG